MTLIRPKPPQWAAREAKRSADLRRYQSIGGLPIIEMDVEPRTNPDGTREFCALLDKPPRRTR